MANVLVDPRERPDIILGDFDTPHPLVTFRPEDVTYTYGSKWKQRYFTRRGDDLFVFPAQWDVQNGEWRRYGARPGTEWWVEHYPLDQMQRPTGPLCDGCHSVNYDVPHEDRHRMERRLRGVSRSPAAPTSSTRWPTPS